jgi:ABC-type branched-subunit amino acid transport system substrate-binding protein
MGDRVLSRRRFLLLSGAALMSQLIGAQGQESARGPASVPVRLVAPIGVVLPTRTELTGRRVFNQDLLGESVRQGALLGEELARRHEEAGIRFSALLAGAPDEATALRAADRLTKAGNAVALIGGLGSGQAAALAQIATERSIPFLNLGSSSDLPETSSNPFTFHVQPAVQQYAAALAAWLASRQVRRPCIVQADTPEQSLRAALLQEQLAIHRPELRETRLVRVQPDQLIFRPVLDEIAEFQPDALALLLPPELQLGFLSQYSSLMSAAELIALPEAATQTRGFYAAAAEAARTGSSYRLAPWDASLVEPAAARELNMDFLGRWGQVMDPSAWAAYAAMKILSDAVVATRSSDGRVLRDYLAAPGTVFEVGTGRALAFRSGDRQLLQPLYVVRLHPEAEQGNLPRQQLALTSVVRVLPPSD